MHRYKTHILIVITFFLAISVIVGNEYAFISQKTHNTSFTIKQTQNISVFDFEAYFETLEDDVQDQDVFTRSFSEIQGLTYVNSHNCRYLLLNNQIAAATKRYRAIKDVSYLAFLGAYRI
ncbi:MAG: hypothetical protein EBR55_04635 [Chitinophagia bacterium]|nr:hypothetical protein [Chitinophagia bacterium]